MILLRGWDRVLMELNEMGWDKSVNWLDYDDLQLESKGKEQEKQKKKKEVELGLTFGLHEICKSSM